MMDRAHAAHALKVKRIDDGRHLRGSAPADMQDRGSSAPSMKSRTAVRTWKGLISRQSKFCIHH